jgi:hypothetical protein
MVCAMAAPTELLNRYASAVRGLFEPPRVEGEDRGGAGPSSPAEIADRAENILKLSDEVTRAEREQLAGSDPGERAQAAQRLLAKSLTEMEISAYLKQAGQDEEDQVPLAPRLHDRSVRTGSQVEDYLDILTGRAEPAPNQRGAAARADRDGARKLLTISAEDACEFIVTRAGEQGKAAFSGLLGVGLTEIAQAAGAIVSVVSGSFGAGPALARLYTLCRDFIAKAYDSILALVGDQLAKIMGDRIVEWVKEVKDEHLFGDWLRRTYQVQNTFDSVKAEVHASNAAPERLSQAGDDLGALTKRFGREMELVKKLLRAMGYLKFVPGLAGPQAVLLRGGGYCLVLAYVFFDGADYLDTPGLELLTRVPGVPAVVRARLA